MSLRGALYVRVSTNQQAQAQTIEQQLERLRTRAAAQGWDAAQTPVYRDEGQSGATLNRPGLDRLRDAVRRGELDHILITEPDRLARNYVHQMILLDEFARAGCQLEFLDRPLGDDPHDRLVLQIRGAVAEYERTLIADRMRRGRQTKYRAGVLLPWTKRLYGYQFDLERPRDPAGVRLDEVEAAVVREIYARYAGEGGSLCALAKDLQRQGIPTPSGKRLWSICTLRAILRQPAYAGQVYAHRFVTRPPRIRRSATHPIGQPRKSLVELPPEAWIPVATIPAVVSQELFDRVQRKLAQNRTFAARNNTRHPYLLRALVSCGLCQAACMGRHSSGGYSYYACAGKAPAVHSRQETRCPSRFSPVAQLDEVVWHDLCEVLTHPASLTQALERAASGAWLPQELQARQEHLRRAQRQLDGQLERLTAAYLGAVMPLTEYERRRRELEQQRQGLIRQGEQLAAQADRQAEIAGMVRSVEAFCQRVEAGLAGATFEQRRQLVELLIDRVVVADGDVEIRYVVPTSPSTEAIRFCHLRSDYFHAPAAPDSATERAGGVLVERGERADPGEDGRGIDAHAALGQQLGHVGIAEAEPQVPAHGERDDVGREAVAAEGRARQGGGATPAGTAAEASLPPSIAAVLPRRRSAPRARLLTVGHRSLHAPAINER